MSQFIKIIIFSSLLILIYGVSPKNEAVSRLESMTAPNAEDRLMIEDFSTSTSGQFPKGWGWVDGMSVRKINEAKAGGVPYTVLEEGGNKYLHADDTGQAITIVSDKKWNLKKYPCLSWRWRVKQFPTGANEKLSGKKDSPASVYVTYYVSFWGIPKSIKYIWSNVLDPCDIFRNEGTGKATQMVIESGTTKKDVWITETINIYELYKRAFGEKPPDEIAGIAIRTDADHTNSRAIADYDDIIALADCDGKCK